MVRWIRGGRYRMVVGLGVLAVAQIGFLLTARGGAANAPPTAEPGFDFSGVHVMAEGPEPEPLVRADPVLVLVFHSSCGHCEVLAPDWAEWMRSRPEGVEVIAVSQEPLASAREYAERHGWTVPVRSVVMPNMGGRARMLVGLTPWVFALDEEGHVVASGHGSEVESVAAAISGGL